MTEVLPVADIDLPELERAGSGNGCAWAAGPRRDRGDQCPRRGRQPHRTDRRRAFRHRRRCACAPPTRNNATTGFGSPNGRRAAIVGGTGPAMSGTYDDEGRLWIEGRLVRHRDRRWSGYAGGAGTTHRGDPGSAPGGRSGGGTARRQQVVMVVELGASGNGLARPRCAMRSAWRSNPPASRSQRSSLVASLPVDIRHNSRSTECGSASGPSGCWTADGLAPHEGSPHQGQQPARLAGGPAADRPRRSGVDAATPSHGRRRRTGLTEHLGDINDAALVAEAVEGVGFRDPLYPGEWSAPANSSSRRTWSGPALLAAARAAG